MSIIETFKNQKKDDNDVTPTNNTFILCHTKYKGRPTQKYYAVKKYACFNDVLSDKPDIDSENSLPDNAALFFLKQENSWWLFNQNSHLCCAVNSGLIAPFSKICLNDGDCIQWGLSEWHIHAEQPEESIKKGDIEHENRVTELDLEPVKMEAVDLKWFSIAAENGHAENPFDLIMPEHRVHTLPTSASDNEGILGHLHNEYIDSINRPARPSEAAILPTHKPLIDTNRATQKDSLLSLAAGTHSLETLQDLVAGSMNIDQIFQGLDSLRETELFISPLSPEILQLFAETSQGSSSRHQPPELTKKEHHALSVDSHYQMGQSEGNQKD